MRRYLSNAVFNTDTIHWVRMGYAGLALFGIGTITWSLQNHPDWIMRYVAGWYQLCSFCFILLIRKPNRSWFHWYLYRTLRVFSFYTLTSLLLWVLVMFTERPTVLLKYTTTYYVPVVFVVHLINTGCLLTYYQPNTIAPPLQTRPLYITRFTSLYNTPIITTSAIVGVYFFIVTIMNQWSDWYGLNLWEAAFILENSLVAGWRADHFLFVYCQESSQFRRHDYNPVVTDHSDDQEMLVVAEVPSDNDQASEHLFDGHPLVAVSTETPD
jgi:hypothetical protein